MKVGRPNPEHGASRLLVVAEAIGLHGPIALDSLVNLVDISRSAVHRACQNLERSKWVYRDVSTNAYRLSHAKSHFFSNARFERIEIESMQPVLKAVKAEGLMHVKLSAFSEDNQFTDIANTQAKDEWVDQYSLVSDPEALVALSSLPKPQQLKFVQGYLKKAPQSEHDIVNSGKFYRQLSIVGEKSYFLTRDRNSCSIPIFGGCSITFWTKNEREMMDANLENITNFLSLLDCEKVGPRAVPLLICVEN